VSLNRIWVVEMYCNGRWWPTVGAGITREEAREEMSTWKEKNPCNRFRVRKYEATPS